MTPELEDTNRVLSDPVAQLLTGTHYESADSGVPHANFG